MSDLDLLHFEQLKKQIQAQYLLGHTPSHDDISKWKGIDIVYFQEDLRKKAKGNISEKTFYTYFKTVPSTRLPRIDMLNILSIYAGYSSWFEFKKTHAFTNEVITEESEATPEQATSSDDAHTVPAIAPDRTLNSPNTSDTPVLQNYTTENQPDTYFTKNNPEVNNTQQSRKIIVKEYMWLGISAALALLVGFLIFRDELLSRKYLYNFIDADRNSAINAELHVEMLKDNESPVVYTAKPNEPFIYTTKSKTLTMVVSSPYYRTDTIRRNLETAPESENIELKPNDYAIMLFYYSKSITDLKKKRLSLDYLISNNALIYQVYDSEQYGVETMDKQRYISLVTLPTTSLENLEVIDTKTDSNGKINMIKFKINQR